MLMIGFFPFCLQAEGFLKSRVDERMELLSIIMRLADVEEYRNGIISEYNRKVDYFFGEYREHPAVLTARKMKRKYNFRRDAVFSLAIHLKIEGDSVFFDPALTTKGMDSRTNNKLMATFIREIDDFYEKTDAKSFFNSLRSFYQPFGEHTDEQIVQKIHAGWFDDFFGWHPSDFCIVQTLLIGEYSFYANTVDREGKEITYFSIRGFLDREKEPSSDWKMARSAVLRGLADAYVHPLIDENIDALKPYTKPIYRRMWSEVYDKPYSMVDAVLYEGITRGVTVYYNQFFEGDNTKLIKEQSRLGYFWLESFSDLLMEYAGSRDKYKTFRDFMPQVISYYKELARE